MSDITCPFDGHACSVRGGCAVKCRPPLPIKQFWTRWQSALEWAGTGAGLCGAFLLAFNIPGSGYGFVIFLVNSTAWTIAGIRMGKRALWLKEAGFTVANIVGIVRWLV